MGFLPLATDKYATTLSSQANVGDTTIVVNKTLTNTPTWLVLDPGLSTEEKVYVSSATGSTLTCTAIQTKHLQGAGVQNVNYQEFINAIAQLYQIDHNSDGSHQISNFGLQDYVVSGLLGTVPTSSLSLTIPNGIAFITGKKVSVAQNTNTYAINKDTYVDVDNTGAFHYTPVANNASAPSVYANSLRIQKVVTNGTQIQSITDLRPLNPIDLLTIFSQNDIHTTGSFYTDFGHIVSSQANPLIFDAYNTISNPFVFRKLTNEGDISAYTDLLYITNAGKVLASGGSGTTGGYSFLSDTGYDTGMFQDSEGWLHLYSNNVNVLQLTSSQQVQIPLYNTNQVVIGAYSDLGSASFGFGIAMPSGAGQWPIGIMRAGTRLWSVDNTGNMLMDNGYLHMNGHKIYFYSDESDVNHYIGYGGYYGNGGGFFNGVGIAGWTGVAFGSTQSGQWYTNIDNNGSLNHYGSIFMLTSGKSFQLADPTSYIHTNGGTIYLRQNATDFTDYIRWNQPNDKVQVHAYGGFEFYVAASGNTIFWTDNSNNVHVNGNFYVSGTKSATEKTSQGDVALYAIEAPESYYEDFGRGNIKGGFCNILIDPLFAECVEGTYDVFLTPYGKCSYIYVDESQMKNNRFRVVSDQDISFSYRIVAHRVNHSAKRFEYVQTDSSLSPKDNLQMISSKGKAKLNKK